ncbi:MAG: tetratricopeptide repeat protein [Ignavibacteria bacterium]|nr:tetratricopeptide repeat protein [Ignavibacteria bacterium]
MSHFLNTQKCLNFSLFKYASIILFILLGSNLLGTESNTKGEKLLNSLIEIIFSKPNEALKLGFEILELPTDEVHDSIRAFAMVEVGFILERQGLPAQALSFYLQGLDLLTEIGMCPISGYLLIDIGNVYYNQKQYDLASDKYNEAIKVFFNYD